VKRSLRAAWLFGVALSAMPANAAAPHAAVSTSAGLPHATATILTSPAAGSREFVPREVFGAALDGHSEGETAGIFTDHNLAEMRGAGLGALAYRLRTELANEAWHWNPAGRWSDAVHTRGYWTSDDTAARAIDVSYGYALPRRGNSTDQADNSGYSRLDDGDTLTFWKSNPYLDPRRTGEAESEHIQWVIIDLGHAAALDAARIRWGEPYARTFRIQFWDAHGSEPSDLAPAGRWRDFALDSRHHGFGGTQTIQLADRPIPTRYVRLLLEQSSHTAPAACRDERDSLGFAIRELAVGVRGASGKLDDVMIHAKSGTRQTRMLVSSTDPWHRARDRHADTEQPGLDLVFRRAANRGTSVMLPVGVLYDTPENAAALLRFVRTRRYPVTRIELGEEPDGQYVAPEDFAALYAQTSRRLRDVDSTIVLGGPSWEDAENAELAYWPSRPGTQRSWMGRFLRSLSLQHARRDFQFFSFEWYPFAKPCPPNEAQVLSAPQMLQDGIATLKRRDVPTDIPWLISEYGYSVRAARAEVELEGALVNADLVGGALAAGCERMYLYGYEPGALDREPDCGSAGNLMMLLADDAGRARYRLPTFYAAWLITHAWTSPTDEPHHVHPVRVLGADRTDAGSAPSAYAVSRPDGAWGVLLVNRDATRSWNMGIELDRAGVPVSLLDGRIELWQYSSAQYAWAHPGGTSHPERSQAPDHRTLEAPHTLLLPPYSITVMVARPPTP
jgi:F5/8 type C domain